MTSKYQSNGGLAVWTLRLREMNPQSRGVWLIRAGGVWLIRVGGSESSESRFDSHGLNREVRFRGGLSRETQGGIESEDSGGCRRGGFPTKHKHLAVKYLAGCLLDLQLMLQRGGVARGGARVRWLVEIVFYYWGGRIDNNNATTKSILDFIYNKAIAQIREQRLNLSRS